MVDTFLWESPKPHSERPIGPASSCCDGLCLIRRLSPLLVQTSGLIFENEKGDTQSNEAIVKSSSSKGKEAAAGPQESEVNKEKTKREIR